MTKGRITSFLLVAWLWLLSPGLQGQVIKTGTVAPEGSPWHEALLELAEEWSKISNGKVQLKIYPGGVAGDESDMLRKMRIGQLHAAALTSIGLISVVPDIEAISFPMEIGTDEEFDYVMQKVGPELERQIEAKGFKVLTWSSAGWVRFFCQSPVARADDLQDEKLFFWGSDTQYVTLLKKLEFNPVPLPVNDLLPSLQTGLVTAFAAPPTVALAFQWFGLAKHMTELHWAPLPNIVVVSMRQWNRVPEELRPQLEASARTIGRKLQVRARELEVDAVQAMVERGLEVVSVAPEDAAAWSDLVQKHAYPVFVGDRFSKEIFAIVRTAVQEYRSREANE